MDIKECHCIAGTWQLRSYSRWREPEHRTAITQLPAIPATSTFQSYPGWDPSSHQNQGEGRQFRASVRRWSTSRHDTGVPTSARYELGRASVSPERTRQP
ncbi:hypothetical protein E2C01_026380 [Portunus trituberculatus]|uniref:Uncharacterized protein n=1 Tax=Portunus trituberculatus TaxID=210409 RepID=A0A5B7EFI2_PORTR|nr:hypothetical protein [Portunus trituberculatus]